jgi:hypothetical protein
MTSAVATRREDGTVIDPDWLVAALKATGVKSAQLARRLEVDGTTVYRWRKAEAPITMVVWWAITHALGLPSTWKPGDPVPAAPSPNDDAT